MNDKKTFKLKEIAEMNGFKHRDITHLHQMGAVSQLIHRGSYGELLPDAFNKWTRLYAEESIALSFVATFYQNLKLVKPSIIAAQKAIESIPSMFFEVEAGVRALPSLILFDKYSSDEMSGRCREFLNVKKMETVIPEHCTSLEIRMGDRFFHLLNNPCKAINSFSFYAITDLFFKFLGNLNLELTDLDPNVIWDMVAPGKNYHGKNPRDFQLEFYKFVYQDLDNILKYLEKNQNSHQESQP